MWPIMFWYIPAVHLLTMKSVLIIVTMMFCCFIPRCCTPVASTGRDILRTTQNSLWQFIHGQGALFNKLPENLRHEQSQKRLFTVLKKCLYHHTFYSVGKIMDYTEEQYNFFYKQAYNMYCSDAYVEIF